MRSFVLIGPYAFSRYTELPNTLAATPPATSPVACVRPAQGHGGTQPRSAVQRGPLRDRRVQPPAPREALSSPVVPALTLCVRAIMQIFQMILT